MVLALGKATRISVIPDLWYFLLLPTGIGLSCQWVWSSEGLVLEWKKQDESGSHRDGWTKVDWREVRLECLRK